MGFYHSMAGELGVGLQDAVRGGVVAGCVHSVGARLVEGGWESHIARVPACDCYLCHDQWSLYGSGDVSGIGFLVYLLQEEVN